MGVFCAGMTSTQRSESANHMLKRYIQKAAPMHLFVSKFNEFLSDRTEQEAREQHVTKMVCFYIFFCDFSYEIVITHK